MAELPNDDDLLHQHTLNVEGLLNDAEFGTKFSMKPSPAADFMGKSNIWSASTVGDFGCYPGYQGNGGSGKWPACSSTLTNGSPVKDGHPSSPESDSGSDHSWRCDSGSNGFGVDNACFSEAIAQWNGINGGAVYDHFRGSSVIDDLGGVHVSKSSRDKSPLRRSQSANSRPTFADVAKKPSSPGSEPTPSLGSDGPVYGSQESLNSLQEKKVKQKAFRPAHPRYGGYHVPLPINPDSKYGLDDFELQEPAGGKMERSFSCNDALNDTSHGVGPVLDELADKECVANGKPDANGSSQQKREWFDPKRIFMNGGNTRTRSESVPSDTILNNADAK